MARTIDAIPRTIQWWRLVDARNGNAVEESSWHQVFADLHEKQHKYPVDGRLQTGKIRALQVENRWASGLDIEDLDGAIVPTDPTTTYGVVLAGAKDYVPNQINTSSGDQQPLGLAGDGWEPVDNLFVWFAPFGNIFGVMAESVSAARANTFAQWLTLAMRDNGLLNVNDPEFAWGVHPVIDKQQAARLKTAKGLRSMSFAGLFGNNVNNASGLKRIFGRQNTTVGALRIEVKVSRVVGHSKPGDEEAILNWFNEEFGSLEGAVTKAQVTVEEDKGPDVPMNEIDLLHHRLTRKVKVKLAPGATRSFEASTAIGEIVAAFCDDRKDLARLRSKIE